MKWVEILLLLQFTQSTGATVNTGRLQRVHDATEGKLFSY